MSRSPANTPTKAPSSGIDPLGTHIRHGSVALLRGRTGELTLEKATNGVDADTPTGPMIPAGNTVTWTYVVTNGSNAPVSDIAVTDSDIGPISCPVDTLAPGASTTCTATGVATAGQYANEGTVSGIDAADNPVGDTDPIALLRRQQRHRNREIHERRRCGHTNRANDPGRQHRRVDISGAEHRKRCTE